MTDPEALALHDATLTREADGEEEQDLCPYCDGPLCERCGGCVGPAEEGCSQAFCVCAGYVLPNDMDDEAYWRAIDGVIEEEKEKA